MSSYADFLRGRMNGLSLTRDGHLQLGPQLNPLYSSDQSQIWSIAQAPDGSLYLGTGNRGRLIKVDAQGRGTVAWTSDQPVIFSLAVDRAGVVYAGTSPDGKVYRIENGRATEYFDPKETYIWSLAFAPDGALYVATGQQGKIYRVTNGANGAGQGALYYETGQAHVMALAFDRDGRLIAGSEPNGIVYRISGAPGQAKGFVLYDANLPEIRSIVPAADGSIYVSALGGSVARGVTAATTGAVNLTTTVTAPPTSITVTDAQAAITPTPKAEAPRTAATAAVATAASATEVSGVEKSALYRIFPDNTVETLWSSKEENLYDVALEASGNLLLLTDVQARLYRLDPRPDQNHDATLLAQASEGDATRLGVTARGVFAATGSAAKLLRLDAAPAASAWFESPVHDAGTVSRWGRLTWLGDTRGVSFKTRSGNSARPDATWSDWSNAITDPNQSSIASPNARYVQWRMEIASNGSVAGSTAGSTTGSTIAPPRIDDVKIAYLPQNTAPTVRSISVSSKGATAAAASTSSASANAAFSITVTDTGEVSSPAGTQAQILSRPAGQQIQVTWQADDAEGDRLSYSLYFRGEDEREWKLLKANFTENTYTLDGDVLADGRYFFRVIASDRLANPAEQARQSELVGAPVLIDSTAPDVKASAPRRVNQNVEIDVDGEDRVSSLKRCEYSVDAGSWLPVEAADGVTDSLKERFLLRIPGIGAGEHVVAIRVTDTAGNAALAKVIVR
jgi:hypothetical protein